MDNILQHEQREVDKFNDLAHEWWDVDGGFKTLHHVNPVRLDFITKQTDLRGKSVIDIGCGGGILAESMARLGAHVTGIDLAPQSIEIAQLHLHESGLNVNYECIDSAALVNKTHTPYDVLTCMEMLEHVPNPDTIISNCGQLLTSGGVAFFSTLNRNLKSYLLGVIAAEYLLKLIPKGTHEYKKFIKPSELSTMLNKHGFQLLSISGIEYNPLTYKASLTQNVDINYIISCRKI